jgi:hypothetical protein
MADADEAPSQQPAANEPPSNELAEQLHAADAEDDIALIHHEMEFASVSGWRSSQTLLLRSL